jgi:hypothetical protein
VSQAIEEILKLDGVERAFATGMCHKLDHDELNRVLKSDERIVKRGIRARAAFDGLILDV